MIDFKKNKRLAELLSTYMDGNNELKTLAMAMGEAPDNVVNVNQSPMTNAQSLCLYMDRRGRFNELLQTIHDMRPDIDLSSVGFAGAADAASSALDQSLSSAATGSGVKTTSVEPRVYVSYAWGGESEEIVNKIDAAFQEKGIMMIRDKRDLGFKGLIKEFMEQIGEGTAVVTVISDKYLRSKNCMFELVEIADNDNFYERIFPVVLPDAKIYDAIDRLDYIQYWEAKINELDSKMRSVSAAYLQGIREDIDLYTRIRNTIAGMMDILQNMNTLTADMHEEKQFAELYAAVEAKLAA